MRGTCGKGRPGVPLHVKRAIRRLYAASPTYVGWRGKIQKRVKHKMLAAQFNLAQATISRILSE